MPRVTGLELAREGLGVPLSDDAEGNRTVAFNLRTPVESAFEPIAGFGQGLADEFEKVTRPRAVAALPGRERFAIHRQPARARRQSG